MGKILRPCLRKNKQTAEHEYDCNINDSRRFWNNPLELERKTGGIGNLRENRDFSVSPF